MPFALGMFVYIASISSVTAEQLLAILLALVAARTAAMTFNRLIDADIDAKNPRTSSRELPSGAVSRLSAWTLFVSSCLVFLFAAALLGTHCLVLALPVLLVLCGYSWAKRFTSLSHLILGMALAMAPGGVWYALTGQFAVLPLWMMAGVLAWVAGFDILYSCQDVGFDRQNNLRSVPVWLGEDKAFLVARVLHVCAVVFLGGFGRAAGLGFLYWLGLAIFAGLLASQHRLVGPGNLERIDAAFFTRNGAASSIFFAAIFLDVSL